MRLSSYPFITHQANFTHSLHFFLFSEEQNFLCKVQLYGLLWPIDLLFDEVNNFTFQEVWNKLAAQSEQLRHLDHFSNLRVILPQVYTHLQGSKFQTLIKIEKCKGSQELTNQHQAFSNVFCQRVYSREFMRLFYLH